jgi:TetR/AcrR family transcriptional regulator, multidrug resistance operon repressor
MTDKKPTYKHFFKERKAILEAALHMIDHGRFQHSAMSDVAYHAKLSQSTALQFYRDRNALSEELKNYVINEVHLVVCTSLQAQPTGKKMFQTMWIALYNYYLRNPGVLRFIDQAFTTLTTRDLVKAFHVELNIPIQRFLESQCEIPASSAALAHANVIGCAKMAVEQSIVLTKQELMEASAGVWKFIVKRQV